MQTAEIIYTVTYTVAAAAILVAARQLSVANAQITNPACLVGGAVMSQIPRFLASDTSITAAHAAIGVGVFYFAAPQLPLSTNALVAGAASGALASYVAPFVAVMLTAASVSM